VPAARAKTPQPKRRRLTADERREEMIAAAIGAFAEYGYHATGTAEIARRAGVSQPYLYALFPDKRALFLACHKQTVEVIRETLQRAREEAGEDEDLEQRLGRAYEQMIQRRREYLLFQLQAHAAAAADPEIRAVVRERFIDLVEESLRLHRAPLETVLGYISNALFYNVALALDLPEDYRLQH
jgi:AcrR family transcriptional regulator